MNAQHVVGFEPAPVPHPRTIALERQVTIEIRAGNLSEAIRVLQLAEHEKLTRKPVTFLDLPAELRNRVYDLSGCLRVMCTQKKKFGFVSTVHADVVSRHKWRCDHDSGMSLIPVPSGMHEYGITTSEPDGKGSYIQYNYDRSVAQQPDLTRVSHQIRADTLPMFYGTNHFVLLGDTYHGTSYRKWLKIIGPGNVALLRKVTLCLGVKPERSMRTPDAARERAVVVEAKRTLQWLRGSFGQETKLSIAWLTYHAPYLENIDASMLKDLEH